ncbi:MAG: PaaI family thioesterase, partial [Blastocatellia bacterium]
MTLADTAMYLAVLAMIGPLELAVTTNLNINFLKKPPQADVVAECRILKLGKRLAVGEVTMRSQGDPDPVAHATVTYSIPPNGR